MSSHSPITSPLGQGERDATGAVLQGTLTDLIDMSLVAKQAHWNVVGKHFRSVHRQLDDLVAVTRQFSDRVAERAVAIGVSPDGRARTVADQSGLREYPSDWHEDDDVVEAMTDRLDHLVARMRPRVEETDKTDLVTQNMLIELTEKLEEARWMWQAQQETD